MKLRIAALLCFCSILVAAGCGSQKPRTDTSEAPVIPVSKPLQREVTDYLEFTGQTNPVQAVDVRARVTGYLTRMPFKEGSEVQAGQLLFEIDPRPYQAQYDQAMAQVVVNDAALKLARDNYSRDRSLVGTGGVAQQDLDKDAAAVAEALARLNAYKASTETYKLNLEFTKVTSPIRGTISRYYLTPWNIVTQDSTLLTTVIMLDPIYTYFDVDETNDLKMRRAVNDGSLTPPQDGKLPIYLGLQGEDGYPHAGLLNFVNNQVNPATGSRSFRAEFWNPHVHSGAMDVTSALAHLMNPTNPLALDWMAECLVRPPAGARMMSPGMFARIRMPLGQPRSALLVRDSAIQSDQGLKYVFVVDKDSKAQYRRVTTGALQEGGLRVVQEYQPDGTGIKPDDRIVVGALQSVRARMEIRTEEISMPILNASTVLGPAGDKEPGGKDQGGKQGGKKKQAE
jgi:multidrug efflux system membrane fusion protein